MTDLNSEAIAVHHLTKQFGEFTAVNDVSFSVKKGEIFGFLGANGSGKSTTIRMLCGILLPSSGSGHVAGFDILKAPEKIKHAIGYMSQKFSLYMDLTPLENIRFYLGVYDIPQVRWEEKIQWVIDITRMEAFKNRMTSDLAPGWRQRLALGCALLHDPGILFLDEPTSGVDPLTRRHFWEFIRSLSQAGVTVFVTTHYMDEAMNCQRIAMINAGQIVAQGSPDSLIREHVPEKQNADLSDVFLKLMGRGDA